MNGSWSKDYIRDGGGHLVATETASGACATCYLTTDHLGSGRAVIDGNRTVVARHDYLPYGEEIPANTAGRFNSPDPGNAGADLLNPQSWNGYAYVMGNPLNGVDPSGLSRIDSNGVLADACLTASPDPVEPGTIDDWWWNGNSYVCPFCLFFGSVTTPTPPAETESSTTSSSTPPKKLARTCPAVPAHPTSTSPTANASEAGKLRWLLPPFKEFVFCLDVRNGSQWDYKQQGRTLSDLGTIGPSPYQDFGNFNFGVVDAAAGFPTQELLRGAGYAQQQAGTSSPQWGHWYSPGPPYGDDPADQAMIRAGIAYYQNGCVK